MAPIAKEMIDDACFTACPSFGESQCCQVSSIMNDINEVASGKKYFLSLHILLVFTGRSSRVSVPDDPGLKACLSFPCARFGLDIKR
jgi:hypothetical protein